MSGDSKVFSLVGKGLKLDTKADIQPHLDALQQIADLQEVHLGGNTLGVEACQALADVLKDKKTLKVSLSHSLSWQGVLWSLEGPRP